MTNTITKNLTKEDIYKISALDSDLNESYQEILDIEKSLERELKILLSSTNPEYNIISSLDDKNLDSFKKNELEISVGISETSGLKVSFGNPTYYWSRELSHLTFPLTETYNDKVNFSYGSGGSNSHDKAGNKLSVVDLARLKGVALKMTADAIESIETHPEIFNKLFSDYKQTRDFSNNLSQEITKIKKYRYNKISTDNMEKLKEITKSPTLDEIKELFKKEDFEFVTANFSEMNDVVEFNNNKVYKENGKNFLNHKVVSKKYINELLSERAFTLDGEMLNENNINKLGSHVKKLNASVFNIDDIVNQNKAKDVKEFIDEIESIIKQKDNPQDNVKQNSKNKIK
jgi:hypothetical protein